MQSFIRSEIWYVCIFYPWIELRQGKNEIDLFTFDYISRSFKFRDLSCSTHNIAWKRSQVESILSSQIDDRIRLYQMDRFQKPNMDKN